MATRTSPIMVRCGGTPREFASLDDAGRNLRETCEAMGRSIGEFRRRVKQDRLEVGRKLVDLHQAFVAQRGSAWGWIAWISHYTPGVKARSIHLWMQTAAAADATLAPAEIASSPSLRELQITLGLRKPTEPAPESAQNGAQISIGSGGDADGEDDLDDLDGDADDVETPEIARHRDALEAVLAEREAAGLTTVMTAAEEDAAVAAKLAAMPPIDSGARPAAETPRGGTAATTPPSTLPTSINPLSLRANPSPAPMLAPGWVGGNASAPPAPAGPTPNSAGRSSFDPLDSRGTGGQVAGQLTFDQLYAAARTRLLDYMARLDAHQLDTAELRRLIDFLDREGR